jgi:hypothetical protein
MEYFNLTAQFVSYVLQFWDHIFAIVVRCFGIVYGFGE